MGTVEKCLIVLRTSSLDLNVKAAGYEVADQIEQIVSRFMADQTRRPRARLSVEKRDAAMVSFMVVPLFDRHKSFSGIMYFESAVAQGALQNHHLKTAKELASELSEKLETLESSEAAAPSPGVSSSVVEKASPGFLLLGASMFALAFVWMIGGVSISANVDTPTPTPSRTAVAGAERPRFDEPTAAARYFMLLVRSGYYDKAHEMLSSSKRAEVSLEEFINSVEPWKQALAEQDSWHPDLWREPQMKLPGTAQCEVEMRRKKSSDKAKSWVWHLVSRGEGWKLEKLDGGPQLFKGS